jgi:hypothetical protein
MLCRNDTNERLTFIIKYLFIGNLENIIFLTAVSLFGSINFLQALVISLLNFTGLTLVIGKCLAKPINRLSRKIIKVLGRFPRAKRIILRYL